MVVYLLCMCKTPNLITKLHMQKELMEIPLKHIKNEENIVKIGKNKEFLGFESRPILFLSP